MIRKISAALSVLLLVCVVTPLDNNFFGGILQPDPAFAQGGLVLEDFALYSRKEIKLDNIGESRGNIGSNGSIDIKKGASGSVIGSLQALGDIKNEAVIGVYGDVTARVIEDKGPLSVSGQKTERADLVPLTLPTLSFTSAGPDLEVPETSSMAFAPGSYGRLKVKKGAAVTLSSGTYYFVKFEIDESAAVNLDVSGGAIQINVTDKIKFKNNVSMQIVGGNSEDILFNYKGSHKVKVEDHAVLRGILTAPSAKVEFKKGSRLAGAAYADSIQLEKGASFRHYAAGVDERPPTADAGGYQTALAGGQVELDGSGSSDPDGDAINYHWSFLSFPDGSSSALSDPTDPMPTFTADRVGAYVIELSVDDGTYTSIRDTATVTVVSEVLDVSDFVLYADDKIKMDEISGGAGHVGANRQLLIEKGASGTITGDLHVLDHIKNDGEITIAGDVFTNSKIDDRGTLTVTGVKVENAALAPQMLPLLSFSVEGPDLKVPESASQILVPGSYGRVEVKKNGTLQFTAGSYFLRELKTDDSAILIFDVSKGRVELNVAKKLEFGKNADLQITGGSTRDVLINYAGKKEVEIEDRGVFRGTLVAPKAKVEFEKDSRLEGAVYARKINLDQGMRFQFHGPLTANKPPVAAGQSITTAEDTPVSIALGGSDPDGDVLAFSVKSQPLHGTLAGTAPNLTYTPDVNYNGADSFTFKANDGQVASQTETVSITINAINDAPVAADDAVTTDEDAAMTVAVLANDTDVDGDTLLVTGFGPASHGKVVDNGDGTCGYTPNENFHGTDTFAYTISDGQGGSAESNVTVTINPVNDAPMAVDDTITTAEDTTLTIAVLANDTDADGHHLTVSDFTQPANGQVENTGDGSLTYTPALNFHGADSFEYTVSDGNGGTDTGTVFVAVNAVNDPTTADAGPDQDVLVFDTVTLDGSSTSDVDGDDLTYQWAFISKPPESSTVLSYPVPGSAIFLADVPGTYEVRLIVNDGTLDSVPDSVAITADYAPFSVLQTKMIVGDAGAGDGLGTAVAIDGDTAIAGTGSAYIYHYDGSVWVEQAKLTAADEESDDHFGAAVSISSDTVLVGAYGNDDDGADSGAAYIFTFDGTVWSELAKLTAADAAAGDNFGVAVAISQNRALVGAAGDDDSGADSGSAYIFAFDGTAWSQQAKLTATDAAAGDGFGVSTSMSADGVMVGAAGDDDSGADAGAAYFFKFENSVWQQQDKLIASDGAPGDGFGTSLAVSGSDAIVGAAGDDDGGADAGAVYIFKFDGSAWVQQSKLTAGDAQPGDAFGSSVAIAGTYAVVGAPGDDDSGQDAGAVYIFNFDGSTWLEIAKLTPEAAHADDHFGGAVAIDGANVFAGAAGNDDGGDDSGAAYVFTIESYQNVNLTAEPTVIEPGASATLSWTSVNAAAASLDQGIGEVPVNGSRTVSPIETTTYTLTTIGPYGTQSASVTVFLNHPPSITVVAPDGVDDTADTGYTIQWVDADPDNDAAVSLYYDTDNSGANGTLIVGGLSENADEPGDDQYVWDTSAIAEGSYYVYAAIDDGVNDPVVDYSEGVVAIQHGPPPAAAIKLIADDAEQYASFGFSVSIDGGYAIVGAESDDDYTGSAYIFKQEGSGWIQQAKLKAGDAETDDYFGSSVSISGDYAIVGAPYDDIYTGSAYIFKREGTVWIQQAKLTAGDGEEDDEFGTSVSISGDYAVVGAWGDDYYTGSAYIFKREVLPDGTEQWSEQAKLTAGDGEEDDDFGYSVSISGDDAIVGADGDDDYTGSAYIYRREGAVWNLQAKLTASDADFDDSFGLSVSIDSDYAVVGANSADTLNVADSGAAYIFNRAGAGWVEQAKISASDANEGDEFGISVAIDGDYVVVGGENANSDATGHWGGTYIFKRQGASWLEQAKLTAEEADEGYEFGGSVSLSGPYAIVGDFAGNGDGIGESGAAYIFSIESYAGRPFIAVIEPVGYQSAEDGFTKISWSDIDSDHDASISLYYDNDNAGTDGTLIISDLREDSDGAADEYLWDTSQLPYGMYYIYAVITDGENEPVADYGSGVVVVAALNHHEVKVFPDDAAAADYFGYSVSINGDYAIVGVRGDDDYGSASGSAYIFKRDGDEWLQQAKLNAEDAASYDYFGWSVSISADYALVGAVGEDDNGSSSGAAYIFKRDGTLWLQHAKLTAGDGAAADSFGYSVSINGDDAIVGASGDDDGGNYSGSAYIFKREGVVWSQQAKLTAGDAAADDYFGYSVSINGDNAIVGSRLDDDHGRDSGSAYIFKREGTVWTQQTKLTAGDGEEGDEFGISVSIDEDYAIIGAYRDNSSAGSAYIFKRDGAGWTEEDKLTVIDGTSYQYFGYAVSISGDSAIVGAYQDDDFGWRSGSAYIFKRNGLDWNFQAKITAGDAEGSDEFGRSVSISGDAAIVGAAGNDDGGSDSGSAYIYNLEDTSGVASITVVEPSGDSGAVDSSFTIKWRDSDYDSNAGIALYYDTDNSGADGTLIVGGLSEDPDGAADEYVWDTSLLPEGTYYVYAAIDDGEHDPVVDYSDGPVTINHTEIKLLAGDPAGGDEFGYSVSMDGDYAIVGAQASNDHKGSAYIFKRDGGWSQQTKLTASDATENDQFGHTVSLSGDYAIVGAPFADIDHGAAYIFKREGSTWTEQVKLIAGDGELYDEFGTSVAIYGEYAVVGAYAADDYAGSVYVFKQEGSTWTEVAKLTASDRMIYGPSYYFGWSVALDGDYISVGAWGVGLPDDDYGGIMEAGAVYIFKRDGAAWTEQAKITQRPADLNGIGVGYRFGYSVSIDDPYIIVGAPGQEDELVSHGEAYVFKRGGDIWTHTATFTATNPQEYDYFGSSVSLDGDHALVGASGDPYDLDWADITGRAYAFSRTGEAWTLESGFDSGQTAILDAFGAAVAIGGGYGLVGAPGPMYGESYPGAAYLFLFSRVNISAGDEQIRSGEVTTLSWSFVDATSVTIDNGIGQVSENGSISVSPAQTTTYTITAVGPWGTFTDSVTVTVLLEPAAYINADPMSLNLADSATLTWGCSTNTETCVIEPDIGSVALSGSMTVTPAATTTYTLTATNPHGSAESNITVEVIWPQPSADFAADPASIYEGESATLIWQSQYADAVTIEPDLGSQDLSGSAVITPAVTTTYTLTASGPGGTRTETVTVTVNRIPGIYYEYDPMGRVIRIIRVPKK